MAHELEMLNANTASMAYVGQMPWHGLGTKVNPNVSIEEMLKAASLDWGVELRTLYMQGANGEMVETQRRALVRDRDEKILTYSAPGWKPLQNKDALEFFRDYTASGGAQLETAGSLRDGRLIWALAKINKDFVVRGSNGRDEVKGYILLASPHEVGKAISVRTTATRVVCANTLAVAERDIAQYSQSHCTVFNIAKAKESIQLSIDWVAKMENDANLLASKKISEFDAGRFISRLVQPFEQGGNYKSEEQLVETLLDHQFSRNAEFGGILDSYLMAPGAQPGTMWGVLNGVTHWADHAAGYKGESRLYNAWFGSRAKLKRDTYAGLLEMAA